MKENLKCCVKLYSPSDVNITEAINQTVPEPRRYIVHISYCIALLTTVVAAWPLRERQGFGGGLSIPELSLEIVRVMSATGRGGGGGSSVA